jgi:hypothetical protein
MKKISPILLGLSIAVAGSALVSAQDQPASTSAPKYLQINVEYTKPGKGGMAHDRTESAFVQAMVKAKVPIHYTAYTAITGKPRTIYLAAFNSFEEMDRANKIMASSGAGAEFDRLNAVDGELLEETRTLIFKSMPELSYHSIAPNPKTRLLEANILQVRPGHAKDFEELAKKVIAAYDKAGSSFHWGAYRILYGEQAGSYVLLTGSNSASDIDQHFGDDPKVTAALSDEENRKLDELRAAVIESSHREMYAANPAQSYVTDEWINADPFWKPRSAAAAAPKPAATEKKPTP